MSEFVSFSLKRGALLNVTEIGAYNVLFRSGADEFAKS